MLQYELYQVVANMKDVLDDFPNLHEESTNGIGITTAGCKDTGTKKKCKKCNTKKCKKGYCKSKCQKTCAICKSCTTDEAMITIGTCTACVACPEGEVQDPEDKNRCKSCTSDEAEITSGTCTACPDGEVQDPDDKTKCFGNNEYSFTFNFDNNL